MDRWSRDQPQPGSLFQRLREAEKRDPGNEVAFPVERATQPWRSIRKTTSCKKTSESPRLLIFADWPQKYLLWPIRSGQFKRYWNWFVKSKCPGARLDLTVNFHHGYFINPTNCPWVSEDGNSSDRLSFASFGSFVSIVLYIVVAYITSCKTG